MLSQHRYLHRLPKSASSYPDESGLLTEGYEEHKGDDHPSLGAHGNTLTPIVAEQQLHHGIEVKGHVENAYEPVSEGEQVMPRTLDVSAQPIEPSQGQALSGTNDDTGRNTRDTNEELPNHPAAVNRSQEEEGSEDDHRRQPPLAIAARMLPGTHGRGRRIGHDGFPVGDRISLKDVQNQAQQQSDLYRELQERYDAELAIHAPTPQDKEEGQDNKTTTDATEYVVEGMIRNMGLGASVFPL